LGLKIKTAQKIRIFRQEEKKKKKTLKFNNAKVRRRKTNLITHSDLYISEFSDSHTDTELQIEKLHTERERERSNGGRTERDAA